jgi:hypothetical protein
MDRLRCGDVTQFVAKQLLSEISDIFPDTLKTVMNWQHWPPSEQEGKK